MFPTGRWNQRLISKDSDDHVTTPFATSHAILGKERLEAILSNLRSSLNNKESKNLFKESKECRIDDEFKGKNKTEEGELSEVSAHMRRKVATFRSSNDKKESKSGKNELIIKNETEIKFQEDLICSKKRPTAFNDNDAPVNGKNDTKRDNNLQANVQQRCSIERSNSDVIRKYDFINCKEGSMNGRESLMGAQLEGRKTAKERRKENSQCRPFTPDISRKTDFSQEQSTSASLSRTSSSVGHVTTPSRSLTMSAADRLRNSSAEREEREALLGNWMADEEKEEESERMASVAAASDAPFRRRPSVVSVLSAVCSSGPILRLNSRGRQQSTTKQNETCEDIATGKDQETSTEPALVSNSKEPAQSGDGTAWSQLESSIECRGLTVMPSAGRSQPNCSSVSFAEKTELLNGKKKKPLNGKWFINISNRPARNYGCSTSMHSSDTFTNCHSKNSPTDDVIGQNLSSLSLKPCLKVRKEPAASGPSEGLEMVEGKSGPSAVSFCRKSLSFRESIRNEDIERGREKGEIKQNENLKIFSVKRSNSLRNISTENLKPNSQKSKALMKTHRTFYSEQLRNDDDDDDDDKRRRAVISNRYRMMLTRSLDEKYLDPVGRRGQTETTEQSFIRSKGVDRDFVINI